MKKLHHSITALLLCAIALLPRSLAAAGAPAYQPPHGNLTSISALADPNADRILFWDDSANAYKYLTPGTGLTITDTTIDVSGLGGGGTVTAVTGTAPIVSSGGTTPAISIVAATGSVPGSMSAADKAKLDAITGTHTGTNTGDQTITLTGDVGGAGTGSFAATIAADAVTLAKMADMATASLIGRNTGGTGNPEVLSYSTVKTAMSLNAVENTALSTWPGTSNVTTLGTIATGTWGAATIAVNKGGTGQTSYTDGQLLIGNSSGNTLTKTTLTGTSNQVNVANGGGAITLSLPQSIATTSTPEFRTQRITTTAAADIPLLLRGVGTDNAGTDNSNGVMFLVTHNGTNNRQAVFGDSASAGSTTLFGFRFIFLGGGVVPNIDGVTLDGNTRGHINLGTDTSNVAVGGTPGTIVQADIVDKFQVFGGNIRTSGVYKVGNNQVVGARDTGFAAMTGTANEGTTYDTATVTTAQLAGRVMAIQAALTTHGLLGP